MKIVTFYMKINETVKCTSTMDLWKLLEHSSIQEPWIENNLACVSWFIYNWILVKLLGKFTLSRSRLWNKTLYFASKIWKLASNITFMPRKWHLTIKKIRAINLESWEKMIEFKFIFMSKSCSSIYPWWSFKTYWPDLVAFCLSQSSSIFVVRKFRSFRTKKVIFIWQVSKHSTKFVFLLF